MARQARRISNTNYYHVVIRGNNKAYVFEDVREKTLFMEYLVNQEDEGLIKLVAWCLMDNHAHIVLYSEPEYFGKAFQKINTRFAMKYHWHYKTSGHVFERRFLSEPIESDEYFVQVIRYVHNNPVKAGKVTSPAEWIWSSYLRFIEGDLSECMQLGFNLIAGNKVGFEKFHAVVDNKEYLEIKEDRDQYRESYFHKIILEVCDRYGIINVQEILDRPEVSHELISQLTSRSGYSLREIAKKLEVPYCKVQRSRRRQNPEL